MTDWYQVEVEPGVEIRVAIDGPDDGVPVLLLHGYLGSALQWDANVAPLVDAGYRVVRPDHRGHGGSSDLGDEAAYTFDALHRDALAVADAFALDRFHLVGHSMGGLVAELIAIRDQQRLRSLVLVDCSPLPGRHLEHDPSTDATRSETVTGGPGTPAAQLAAHPTVGDRLRRVIGYRIGPARLVRRLAPALQFVSIAAPPERTRADRRAALAALERSVAELDPAAFVAFGEQLGRHVDLCPLLPSIQVPTTVVVGEHEIARLRAGAEALHAGIADARLVEIEGAGHSPPMEQAERFNAALLDHLGQLDQLGQLDRA